MRTWKELKAYFDEINPRQAYYIGDTQEEFDALITMASMGVLWEQISCGPCGGGAIAIAVPNTYNGIYPLMADPNSKSTMGGDIEDGSLICSQHNRMMVKLYLSLIK